MILGGPGYRPDAAVVVGVSGSSILRSSLFTSSIVLGVMIAVVVLWMSSQWTGLDVTMVAFAGLGVLLVSDVLRWEGALAERLECQARYRTNHSRATRDTSSSAPGSSKRCVAPGTRSRCFSERSRA